MNRVKLVGFVFVENNEILKDESNNILIFNDYYDAVDYMYENESTWGGIIKRYYQDGTYGDTKFEDEEPMSPPDWLLY